MDTLSSKLRTVWVCILFVLLTGLGAAAYAEEEFETHGVELFLGGSTRFADGENDNGFSYGLGYEYRFIRSLGVGVTGEGTTGDLRDAVLLFPLCVHPWRGLKFVVAPGAEFSDDPTEFVLRLGLSYEFEIWKHFSISPEFNVDLVDGEQTLVYGLSLGWGF